MKDHQSSSPVYADIVEVIAPDKARSGDIVSVEVRVKNLWTDRAYMTVTSSYDTEVLILSPSYSIIPPGEIGSFIGSFTMPNKDIRLHVWSWYWNGSQWQVVNKGDDYACKDIKLIVLEPVFTDLGIKDYVIGGNYATVSSEISL